MNDTGPTNHRLPKSGRLRKSMPEATNFPRRIVQVGRAHCAVNYALSNCTLVEVNGGYVIIDTLPSVRAAKEVKAEFDRRVGGELKAIIYTHSHPDHIRGTTVFHRPGVPIWAHERFRHELIQQTRLAQAHHSRGGRQFGFLLAPDQVTTNGIGPPLTFDEGPMPPLRLPTHLVHDAATMTIGGVRFELRSAPGETHDHLFIWLPDDRILIAGDNFYKGFPNLYAIRGVPARPVAGWIESLDTMRYLEPAPEHLVLGHTEPVSGVEQIHQLLTDYRDAIAFVHDSVVRMINEGKTPDEMVEHIRLPAHLQAHPYLQEVYGTVAGSIRGIYAGYLGWFDGNATTLEALPTIELAHRLVPQLGGPAQVLQLVQQALDSGDAKWAAWLCDQVLALDPKNAGARKHKARALEQMAATVFNPLMRHWYLIDAALLLGKQRPPTWPAVNVGSIEEFLIDDLLGALPVRLDPARSADVTMTVGFEFTDSGKQFTFFIRRGVGEVVNFRANDLDLLIRTTEYDFKKTVVAHEAGPLGLEFWKKVQFEVPGHPLIAPLRKLWRLKRFVSCLILHP